MTLLVLTVWQPWASLIMLGAKPFEFRAKSYLDRQAYRIHPNVGDRVVVHAAARPVRPSEVDDLWERLSTDADTTGLVVDKAREILRRVRTVHRCRALPLGAGLGTARIGEPRNAGTIFTGLPADSNRGDFNMAWPLSELRHWDQPVPMRGQQGFWTWPEKLSEAA